MNTLDAIKKRRSIKHFDPNHQINDTEIQLLMDHALLSPTSFNIQNWRFVLVTDKNQKSEIKKASFGQNQMLDASLLIVICADLEGHKYADKCWSNAPENVQKIIVPMVHDAYRNKPNKQNDEALRSTGIVAQTIMLAAKSIDYDTCPMIGFEPEKLAKIINLPEDHVIGLVIAVGKAIKPANKRSGSIPREKLIYKNKFS